MKVKGILVFILMASLIVTLAGPVAGKSVYVIADIAGSPTPIQAYDVQTAPNYLVYQATYGVPSYAGGAVGLAIDTDSEMLFITYEGSNRIQLVDAKTMTDEGYITAPNANNLAGVVVDQDKQKVYTVDRGTDNLYVYSWDATTKTLTLDFQTDLSGVTNAHGLALDEVNDLLYVGDMVSTNNIDVFSTDDWSSVTSYTVSELVQGIAVDVKNGYVYAGNSGWYGGDRLCKYDMNTDTETYVEITTLNPAEPDAGVVGLAVDPVSSLLYVTTGNQGSEGRVYDDWDCILVFDSDLNLLFQTGDIGNPTGICVPGKDISYNPLNLAKNDAAADCGVYTGLTFTYEITSDNNDNLFDVTGVTIVDELPVELDFVSETVGGTPGTGIYDAPTHTVTWNIGTIQAGQAGPLVELVVTVNQIAIPSTTIYNHCRIESDQTPPTTVTGRDPDCPPEDPSGTPIIPVPFGCVAGYVTADCPAPGTALLGVEIDVYEGVEGELIAGAVTDANGYYEICEVLAGDHTATIVTPLGYSVSPENIPVTIVGGETSTVDFSLTCVEITANPRTQGFWKHQFGVAISGRGNAQIDAATLCDYLDEVDAHFNNNGINEVVIYEPPGTGVCDDKLAVAKELLNLKGSVDMVDRAKQQLMALLMNVVAGNIHQMDVISVDGATVSQAITYCDNAIDDVSGDHEQAKTIADLINNNQVVPAGEIDLSTPNIAYRVGLEQLGFCLGENYPNPFNAQTSIAFDLSEACHVRLTVFNILGQVVAVPVDRYMEAGSKSVVWNANNVGSGMYFYRLEAGSYSEFRKMTLLK